MADLSVLVGFGCDLLDVFPSPDGYYLAAQVSCEWGGYVLLADLNSGQVTRLSGALGDESILLDWQPGNQSRLVVRANPTGDGGVYLVDPRTLESEQLPVPGTSYNVAFSPDGTQVLFVLTKGLGHGSELWLMNRDGNSATLLLYEPQHIIALPRWSPDSRQWVYIRMVDNEMPFTVGELWVMDKVGMRMLSNRADAGHGYVPVWSPDGRHIAFVARENADNREADMIAERLESNIYLAEVASGQVQTVTCFEKTLVETPVWTVDGRLVFVAGRSDKMDVWQVKMSDGAVQQMTHVANARLVAWLPGASR